MAAWWHADMAMRHDNRKGGEDTVKNHGLAFGTAASRTGLLRIFPARIVRMVRTARSLSLVVTLFITLSIALCLLTACSRAPYSSATGGAATPPPAADNAVSDHAPLVETTEETAAPAHEIPLYNDYQITLEVEPETRTVRGIERIRFTNRTDAPLTEVVARVYLNAFSENETRQPYFDSYTDQIFLNGKDYGRMDILHVSRDNDELAYTLDSTVLTIALNPPLAVEETVLLKIQFEAYIPQIAHRTGANAHAIWCGAFLPVLSVHDGEGWLTEPYYPAGDPFCLETANYTVEITTPVDYEVAGSGVKRVDSLEDRKVTTFTANMTRDFAFALSPDYKIAESTTDSGVNILFYYYSEGLPVEDIIGISAQAVAYFETYVGKYPHTQLSIVETDMFVRGMEFSKLVMIDSAYLNRTQTYTNIVHELGHQWFYNVVGNNEITEAWLDEGLIMFVQEGFFHETEADLQAALEKEHSNLSASLDTIKNAEARRIASSVAVYENWTDYYQVQYMKAKMMMFALYRLMGPAVFEGFVNDYYKTYSFRIATAADFIAKAEEAYGEPLTAFFDEWLYGETLPALPAPR